MEFAVRLEEADIEEEGLFGARVQEGNGSRSDIDGARGFVGKDAVVAYGFGFGGDVLKTGKSGFISGGAEGVNDVAVVIRHGKSAMREAQHAVRMRALSCKQRCAAR